MMYHNSFRLIELSDFVIYICFIQKIIDYI